MPLAGLKVVDAGLGMPAALIVHILAELGADVIRLEPTEGDPFYDIYPAYRSWRRRAAIGDHAAVADLVASADLCIIGGEDYPELTNPIDPAILALNAKLILVDLTDPRPQVDILAQARSGLAFAQFSDRPLHHAFPAPSYGAAMQALIGIAVALVDRDKDGHGQTVSTSLDQASGMWLTQYWLSAERWDAAFDRMTPKDVRPLILKGSDGGFVHFAMSLPGALARVHAALGIESDVDPKDPGFPGAQGPNFFGDIDLFQAHAASIASADLLGRFHAADIPAEPVLAPGDCWNLEQAAVNGIMTRDGDGRRYCGIPLRLREAAAIVQADPTSASRPARIVEFGSFVAGPYTSRLLADFGFDVVKVEPLGGDPSRQIFRTSHATNFGKRSISVDAKAPEGAEILARLIRNADMVSHNFRPGAAARLGLGFEQLSTIRPGIVVLASSAYGEEGPKVAAPGFDYIMQAFCGHELRAGGAGNAPLWYRSPITDYATGALGAFGLLIGLKRSRDTSASVKVENSLFNVGIFLLSELVEEKDGSRRGAPINDTERLGFHPAERMYRCRDGWVAIAARTEKMTRDLVAVLDIGQDLGPRSEWGEAAVESISRALRDITVSAAIEAIRSAGVWIDHCVEDGWSEILRRAEEEEGLITRRPNDRYGLVSSLGPSVSLSARPTAAEGRGSPRIGEHTREILHELGFSEQQIADFHERHIVRSS